MDWRFWSLFAGYLRRHLRRLEKFDTIEDVRDGGRFLNLFLLIVNGNLNQEIQSKIDRLFLSIDEELTSRKPMSARDRRLLALTRKTAILFEIFQAEIRGDTLDVARLRKIYSDELKT